MDFRRYAQGMKFARVEPSEPAAMLEVYNTVPPEFESLESNMEIARLCSIPRMSTYAVALLINKAVREMPDGQCFVNVGVWHGFTFLAGMSGNPGKKCIGVDNFSEFGGPRAEFRERFLAAKSENHSFFEMGYRQYFAAYHRELVDSPIGFYIYDGKHDYQSQLDGLKTAEPFLADGALVMVDDWSWPDPERATLDFIEQSAFNYEPILVVKTASNNHPTWHNGIGIFRKGEKNP